MVAFRTKAIFVVASLVVSTLLHGCSFGTEQSNCNGESCACSLTFRSFWARVRISGVPIEHSSRWFYIPDVAKDVENATVSPCCDAIFDQIDYDEGKTASMPVKAVDSFRGSCAASPNKDISSAATAQSSGETETKAVARRLHGLRKDAAPMFGALAKAKGPQVSSAYLPIDDGQVGQDCEVSTSDGFKLNNMSIANGASMKLKIRWVDPEQGSTPCCNALRPLLENVYFKGMSESELAVDLRKKFCSSCKASPNQGIALAAYRCFEPQKMVDETV